MGFFRQWCGARVLSLSLAFQLVSCWITQIVWRWVIPNKVVVELKRACARTHTHENQMVPSCTAQTAQHECANTVRLPNNAKSFFVNSVQITFLQKPDIRHSLIQISVLVFSGRNCHRNDDRNAFRAERTRFVSQIVTMNSFLIGCSALRMVSRRPCLLVVRNCIDTKSFCEWKWVDLVDRKMQCDNSAQLRCDFFVSSICVSKTNANCYSSPPVNFAIQECEFAINEK